LRYGIGLKNAGSFPSGRSEISIEEEIYGDQGRILRESRRKFTGIKEEFYGDQGENLRGSRKNFTRIKEKICVDRRGGVIQIQNS
jgi:hypothetical protein